MLETGLQYSLKLGVTSASAITSCVTSGSFLTCLGHSFIMCVSLFSRLSAPLGYTIVMLGDYFPFLGISLSNHELGRLRIA